MANNHFTGSVNRAQTNFDTVFDPLNRIHDPMDVTKIASLTEGVMQQEDTNDLLTLILAELKLHTGYLTTIASNTSVNSQILTHVQNIEGKIT